MDVIRLLPDSVANQIAAGEVIQRPASVVKELVENAIDAGAHNIDVSVTDAGKTCIQVIDDGKGMSETDARLAFERHATSKISVASDLFSLRTMGFRGEALASIAAVAQVELRTCQPGAELGTVICISGSKVESQEVTACPVGSSFSVKNLFFNVPARRKFLKSNQTELSNILTEFERIALVNPEISFSLSHNGTELLNLPNMPLRQRILCVFGKKLNQDLLPLDVETMLVKIHGFIGKPESSKKKGARQFFFANGRYMRHPYFHRALADAYEKLIPVGEQMSYFIYFEVDPANIDVNIHPTKTEIKFENEQAIWQILSAAVKETLGRFNQVPSIDFDTEGMPDIPAFGAESYFPAKKAMPSASVDKSYNPFKTHSYSPFSKGASNNWQPLYEGLERNSSDEWGIPDTEYKEQTPENTPSLGLDVSMGARHYQYKGTYILTSVKSGLMIIDQHRAHVNILYNDFMRSISSHARPSQRLMFPDMVQFSASEVPALEAIMDDLATLGFDISPLGGGSYSINGVPEGIEGLSPETLVTNMVRTAIEKGCKVKEEVQSAIALSMAKSAAIVQGQILSSDEMNSIVDRLFAVPSPNFTPDGKTVLTVIKDEDIEKSFR